ncbi:MAG: hypothetical protein JKY61_08140 [Planctomycetes bacterium]|nr:hypothetical protein [Planctomycetota bacterium]
MSESKHKHKNIEDAEARFPEDEMPSIRRVMMPKDTNAVGTIFGGTILAEIDLAAATEAHKSHAGMVVTVSMDKIDFKKIDKAFYTGKKGRWDRVTLPPMQFLMLDGMGA